MLNQHPETLHTDTHGVCSHCRAGKRLKNDGMMPRHLDYRRGRDIQQGWCPGSDQKPKDGAPDAS